MGKNGLILFAWLFSVGASLAGDWPQILGPDRNGVAVGETLLDSWPSGGPHLEWASEVGQGFAGVAVRDDVVTIFHRVGGTEVVECRNAATGKEIWSQSFSCDYQSGMSSDSGPRCVPVVGEKTIIVFGANGRLRCLSRDTGKQIWFRDTWKDFSAPEGYFGAGSSPLVVDDKVLVNVGGRDNAAIVAFSMSDGGTAWRCFDDTASYSSPVLATIGGQQQAIFVTRLNVVSVAPKNGDIVFQFPFGARGPTVNGANPVVIEDQLFVTASYRVGSAWAKVGGNPVEPVRSGESLLASQFATPIEHNGMLYAVDGRQDIGTASLKCVDPHEQKVLWEKNGFGYGTILRVNDEFLFLTHTGELIRFAADPSEYREIARCSVLENTDREYRLPAVSNGRLFVRGRNKLKCLRVGKVND